MTTYIVQYSKGQIGSYSNIFYGTKKRATEVYGSTHLFKHNKKRLIAVNGKARVVISREYRK